MSIVTAITSGPGAYGNIEAIVNALIDGAMGLSTNIINLYHLDRLRIISNDSEGVSCHSPNGAPIVDDICEILDTVKESDCVIFATPTEDGEPNDLMGILLHRIKDFESNRTDSKDRTAFIIVTCPEEKDGRKAISSLTNEISDLGFSVDSTIIYADHHSKSAKEDEYILAKAKRLGLSLRNN